LSHFLRHEEQKIYICFVYSAEKSTELAKRPRISTERELFFSTLTKYPMSLRGFLRLPTASTQMSPASAPIAMKQEGTRPKRLVFNRAGQRSEATY
jgi:hypothetical protein